MPAYTKRGRQDRRLLPGRIVEKKVAKLVKAALS
jgi:hypothetical protein